MFSYLLKWMALSLIMPLAVMFFGRILNQSLILTFWPGAIALLALGGEKRPFIDVVYVWSMAIGLNVLLYVFVGVIIFYIKKMIKYYGRH